MTELDDYKSNANFFAVVASLVYFFANAKFLPRMQAGKRFRWDYDFIERGEAKEGYVYGMTDLDDDFGRVPGDGDEMWSLGTSSSVSSGGRSPAGMRSPIDGNEDEWEGETLSGGSEGEKMRSTFN